MGMPECLGVITTPKRAPSNPQGRIGPCWRRLFYPSPRLLPPPTSVIVTMTSPSKSPPVEHSPFFDGFCLDKKLLPHVTPSPWNLSPPWLLSPLRSVLRYPCSPPAIPAACSPLSVYLVRHFTDKPCPPLTSLRCVANTASHPSLRSSFIFPPQFQDWFLTPFEPNTKLRGPQRLF